MLKMAALFTLVGFSVIGSCIVYFLQDYPTQNVIWGQLNWMWQTIYGLTYGAIAALLLITVASWQVLEPSMSKFRKRILETFQPSFEDIIFYSFCAAVGEEILFRAAIQPFLGVWPTAFLFIAIHGYLNPYDWRMSIIGLLEVIIVAGIGYLFIHVGLLASIWSHFIFDVIAFSYLVYYSRTD